MGKVKARPGNATRHAGKKGRPCDRQKYTPTPTAAWATEDRKLAALLGGEASFGPLALFRSDREHLERMQARPAYRRLLDGIRRRLGLGLDDAG